jgi:DNA polymerase IV
MKQSEVPQFTILRKVVHIYIDDFFALVEQSASASRRHTPLIVVGEHPQNKVEAVSPAARALGLAPGMARYQALKHAPQILCIKPDREKYHHIGQQISTLYREYTEWVEIVSPAEAYLDITYNKMDIPFARRTAQLIRSDLSRHFGIKARIGIAPNKMLAKIASTTEGDAMREVTRGELAKFLADKPIALLPYIGAKTKAKLTQAQIETIGQLAQLEQNALRTLCGRQASLLWQLSRGHDDQPVCPTTEAIASQVQLSAPLYALDEIRDALRPHVDTLAGQLRRRNLRCRQLAVRIRQANGKVSAADCQLSHFSDSASTLLHAVVGLITAASLHEDGVRSIDINLSLFTDRDLEQLDLFSN